MHELPGFEFFALQQAVAGRYSLDREIGRGGMGVVFLARDVALDRLVAIKLLPPELSGSPALRARFLREARTAAKLSHPNIVPIYAVEERDDLVYFVMALVDGETLGERVRRDGPLSAGDGTGIVRDVGWALAHAHARGIVHRDVKPDNVLLDRETGRAMVTDFGIARAAAFDTPAGGMVAGTPRYMSPEQARGEPADGRSDIYSLGVTAFWALTARHPFEGSDVATLLVRQATEAPPLAGSVRRGLPQQLTAFIDRCLAFDPADRWPTADALANALGGALAADHQVPARVRRYLSEFDTAGSEVATAFTGAATSVGVLGLAFGLNDTLAGVVFYTAASLLAGLGVARAGRLAVDTRGLMRDGYSLGAVRQAIALQARAGKDEEPVPQGVGARSWLALLAGAGVMAGSVAVLHSDLPWVLQFLAAATSVVAPTLGIRRVMGDVLGGKGGFRRLLGGRFGRAWFSAAGAGVRESGRPRLVGGEPTAVVVARAAEELFAALPAAERRELREVPDLIARLETAALEALRLDLLRMRSAAGGGDLTRDLDAARRIGDRIDAHLAAGSDAISEATPTPA